MYWKIICLLLFTSFYKNSIAQTANRWKGYERINVTVAGHSGYYIKPANALPGHPWVWRSSFPAWHTEMDSLLLSKGMSVAYINVDDQYGSPAALQVWDKFYNYLTDAAGLSARPALEAVSRGALYAMGWAKRNPDKVSCIYAETPVYDIKSWPGGKGKGPGDAAAWKQLKDIYHFTEAQAIAFDDNPVDHLEGLAAFKIPVLNVIGIHDQLAPREENTDIFVSRYTALGGPVTISPVTEGPQEMQGHHFPIKHAASYAGFILENSYPVKKVLPYTSYINTRSGLSHFYQKAVLSKQANIAFLGGSITYNPGWRQKVCTYLKERFPETQFHFIAAGIPSLGSLAHTFRLQQDVLDSGRIDLMFVEAAVNDRGSGVDSITQLRSLEGIIRHAKKSNPAMDIIMMEFADTYKSHDYDNGIVPQEVARHEAVASHYQLASINQAKAVAEKINNGEFTWKDDFGDIHPAPYGQELYFAMIKALFKTCFSGQPSDPGKLQRLPAPLDKANFDKGHYDQLSNAVYDKGWTMIPSWTPANGQSTREGFVNVPMLTTEKEGATLTLPFTGNAIGMAIISGNDAGMISYQIDKGSAKTLDLFTEWSSSLHLPYYICLGSDLKKGKHTLTIKMLGDKNTGSKGHACRIVHFLLNDN